TVPPITSVAADGSTATDATGTCCTVTATTADAPFELAATCVFPTDFPVITPADVTVTMFVSALDQNTVAPDITCPFAPRTSACSVICAPTVSDGALGVMAI